MHITNLEDFKRKINQTTVGIFLIIFSTSLIGLFFTHERYVQKNMQVEKQEIRSAENLFKFNLSEKLSIIASSSIFLDYLHSGPKTRNLLKSQFIPLIAPLFSKSIIGMDLINLHNNEVIFSNGIRSKVFVSLKLCYINHVLDSNKGDCDFYWKLFFDSNLLKELQAINNSITSNCKNCQTFNFFGNNHFGSLPIYSSSDLKIKLGIKNNKNNFLFVYVLLLSITLIIFGYLNWYRISSLLNQFISVPLEKLSNLVKENKPVNFGEAIEEIRCLANEISSWQLKSSSLQKNEHAAKLANIAAQLAHDVRSPLSAIDMTIRQLPDLPDAHRIILNNASQRISSIANNFLKQYKKPSISEDLHLSAEHIPSLLKNIFLEKQQQYLDKQAAFSLEIDKEAWDSFALIQATEFKTIISNLINNAVEAIVDNGRIIISLNNLKNMLLIKIRDNGCGIPDDLIDKVQNGYSFGKSQGHGLGISHAKRNIHLWKGDLKIISRVNEFTEAIITLPQVLAPSWLQLSLSIKSFSRIYIIDNEPIVHTLWQSHLSTFKTLKIKYFISPNSLIKHLSTKFYKNTLFLVDYELGPNQPNGLELIKSLNILSQSVLVTNRYDDFKLQQECLNLGLKIIPKPYILNLPVY